jgi:hypothetical protein
MTTSTSTIPLPPGVQAGPVLGRPGGLLPRTARLTPARRAPSCFSGPWLLAEADLVRGRTVTSWPSLATDLRNAGATWVDTAVQICTTGLNVLVTSRKPDDLPAFCDALVTQFSQAPPA